MAIRLTESKLRQIIREEVANLNEGANTSYEARAFFQIISGYERSDDAALKQAIYKAWWKVSKDAGLDMGAIMDLYTRIMRGVQGTGADVTIAALEDFIEQADSMLGGSLIELTTAALSPTRANHFSMRMRQHRPKTEEEKAEEKARRSAAALRGHGARGSVDYSRYGG